MSYFKSCGALGVLLTKPLTQKPDCICLLEPRFFGMMDKHPAPVLLHYNTQIPSTPCPPHLGATQDGGEEQSKDTLLTENAWP
jgi:hypothetical protein